jgi:hypothetical protein
LRRSIISVLVLSLSAFNCTGDGDGDGDNDGPDGDEPAARADVGGACAGDNECREDLFCADIEEGGHCEKDCTADEECGPGAICSTDLGGEGGTCYKACSSDADCRTDRVCAGGVQPRLFCDVPQPVGASCLADNGCEDGLICADPEVGGHCEKDCNVDEDCGEGGICTTDNGGEGGTCYKACSTDADCRSDRACVGGVAPRLFCDPPL